MKKAAGIFTALSALLLLAGGCATPVSGPQPVTGFIYSNVQGPGYVTDNTGYTKEGRAECESYVGWFASGDCSISTIMKENDITKVHHVDYKTKSFLGLYARVIVIVYGD